MQATRFHLAFPVHELAASKTFYRDMLGCKVGRETEHWVDFDFFGHQLSAHLSSALETHQHSSEVDGVKVPLRHFGVILSWQEWEALAARLQQQHQNFLIAPSIRFRQQPAEQATFFILDPSGNGLEFKAFRDQTCIFASD